MKQLNNLPDWLAIVGQSGSGKGSALEITSRLCKENGIEPLFIGTGDLIRENIKTRTHMMDKMQEITNAGLRQPPIIAASLWVSKMLSELKEGQPIIHEGSPRSAEEFSMMMSLVDVGYFKKLKVLEVYVPEKVCRDRLISRTMHDKRIDLSKEGQPGMPDLEKIATKMKWWTENRNEIMYKVKRAGAYLSVANTGTMEELENQITRLFD
jgi:adenylate kinase family enzyme